MAELLAANTAIGVASSLVTFGEVAWRIVKRLRKYNERRNNVPDELKSIVAQLPLLIAKIDDIRQSIGHGTGIEPESPLANAIVACDREIATMDSLTQKLLPTADDSTVQLAQKAFLSIKCEKEVVKTWTTLHSYISIFTFHLTEIKASVSHADADKVSPVERFEVPFSLQGIPLVKNFVSRDTELRHIENCMLPWYNEKRPRTVFVLHGLGGMGKTQLTVEFARKNQESYSAVLWINSASKKQLLLNIARLAARLPQDQILLRSKQVADGETGDIMPVVKDVLKWLSQPKNNKWLLIFDNVDRDITISPDDQEAFDIKDFFPDADHGSVIVTTRVSSLQNLGPSLQLDTLNRDQSLALLQNELGYKVDGLEDLLILLQGLPLALAQAGSYMRQTNKLPKDYIKLYQQRWFSLMQREHKHAREEYQVGNEDEVRSVLTTWSISMDSIRHQNPDAANLLLLWAFLDNHDVWHGLLSSIFLEGKLANRAPEWLKRSVEDELDYDEHMQLLMQFSMISARIETSSYSMHPVIHRWCLHAIPDQDKIDFQRLAMMLVAAAIPETSVSQSAQIQRRLLPHCEMVTRSWTANASKIIVDSAVAEDDLLALSLIGDLYKEHDHLIQAEQLYIETLARYEKSLGPDHPSTLETVHNLGSLYSDLQKNMEEAKNLLLRALSGKEKLWGLNHPSTGKTLNRLGLFYMALERNEEAKQYFLQALAGQEKSLGPDHTTTLKTVNNLGLLYSNLGQFKEAEKLFSKALVGYEKSWGVDHPASMNVVNNLGLLCILLREFEEAEKLYFRAIAGYEKSLGPNHTLTLNAVSNLGNVYTESKQFEKAEKLYLRALLGKEKVWGVDHPSTLQTVNNLGFLYTNSGKAEEAERLYFRSIDGYGKLLGPDHPTTLLSVNNLGLLYQNLGKMEEAKELHIRALAGFEKSLQPNHLWTLEAVYYLATLHQKVKEMEDAEKLYLRALAGYEESIGPENPLTLQTANSLKILYEDLGRAEEAEKMALRSTYMSATDK